MLKKSAGSVLALLRPSK